MRPFAALFIAVAIIVSAAIGSHAWIKGKKGRETVSVTGLASRDFTSDLIVWKGSFSRMSLNSQEAFADLKKDAEAIKSYLIAKGVKENEIVFSSVNISKQYDRVISKDEARQVFKGNMLTQQVQIESKEVDKIEGISRAITELLDKGIELNSSAPNYFYTKLANLKIEMLAAATKDARTRAEKIAENAKAKLGNLENADMGVFQITGQNSDEDYSYGGAFNTSSKNKTASITVRLDFGIK